MSFAVIAIVALLTAPSLAGCGRGTPAGARRIVEREETVGAVRVRLRSELAPARGTLGDPITWRLTAVLGGNLHAHPVILEPPPFSLEVDSANGAWRLRGFDIGAIPLPRALLPVLAADRVDTLEFPRDTLFVDSLTSGPTGNLRPDRGPIQTPLRTVDYVVAAAAAAILLLAALLLVRALRRSRRRAEIAEAPPLPDPPETVLERSLAELERELATLPRDLFYERLAQALRAYAQAVTGIPAPDLTTSELDRELTKSPRVGPEGRAVLIGALRRADLAKFARYRDEESEARSILREARSVPGRL